MWPNRCWNHLRSYLIPHRERLIAYAQRLLIPTPLFIILGWEVHALRMLLLRSMWPDLLMRWMLLKPSMLPVWDGFFVSASDT